MSKKKHRSEPGRDPQDPPPEAQQGEPPGEPPAGPADDPLAALQAERDDLFARLQRVCADYQNYQKRVQRDVEQGREYAHEEILKALLPVLDDMERALEAARANHRPDDPLLTGMQLVHDNALKALASFGLTPIEAVGHPFDPEQHAAVVQQPTREHPPRTVVAEVRKGYRLKDRTLRPSGVVVAMPPEQEEPGGEARSTGPPRADGDAEGAGQ